MNKPSVLSGALLGIFVATGLYLLGHTISRGLLDFRALDRVVTVKGLAEEEVKANAAIWPITFNQVDNNLNNLYSAVQGKTDTVIKFLKKQGFTEDEISVSQPAIDDRQAQGYVDPNIKFRYIASVTVSVYTNKVDNVLQSRNQLLELVKDDIAVAQNYQNRTEFIYTDLNTIKPKMVQQATENAREVAEKFAHDSNSSIGKIKNASQGTFSIEDRDSTTPYIKKIRVVSTISYYLKD
ncbi:SIMPL domain-containing protein [Shewanella sp. A3A]|uniref:SIMPL domain-containing protein n=1 Tax=Shewanella electrica TaxID=515560 RepID=A0ABT2FFX1_9GAMM|nr:SIMPL domain-containing protein [Shewanella electrica]MCH1918487.1 SIMPL domain-containing protein [Shewanella ferrihydritica]MCH1925354.1 SIMPL domain-containing protein [Shewanella electrica]MCS4555179.1 SIMPL domain-containing protein [Shewanella electrica]